MLAKMIIWPWADQKKEYWTDVFFTHVDNWSQVEWKHDLGDPAKLGTILLAFPTV